MDSADQKLQARIRTARVEAGLTQQELGDQIGVVRKTMNAYESAEKKVVTIPMLRAIAHATRKPITWFFLDEDPSPQPEEPHDAIRRVVREELVDLKKEVRRLRRAGSEETPRTSVPVRLLREVAGGPSRDAGETEDDVVHVPRRWTDAPDEAFALRVTDDAMSPTICEGDVVVVVRRQEAQRGQVVVLRLADAAPDGQVLIRRLAETARGIFLEADNRKHERIPMPAGAVIIGVVRGLLRDL